MKHFFEKSNELGLFVTVSLAFSLDEEKDDQDLFDDFQDDTELEDSSCNLLLLALLLFERKMIVEVDEVLHLILCLLLAVD